MKKLSDRQHQLLKRVCLKRYRVMHEGYLGSFRPNASVVIYDNNSGGFEIGSAIDGSFRPSTVNALRDRGLVRLTMAESGCNDNTTEVKPTAEGLRVYMELKGSCSAPST
jgi:hypothetical protein